MVSNSKNGFKCIEYVQLEGNFKLKKAFCTRSQIPVDALTDDLHSQCPSVQKTEPIPHKMDFHTDINSYNQILNFRRIQTYQSFLKGAYQPEERKIQTEVRVEDRKFNLNIKNSED